MVAGMSMWCGIHAHSICALAHPAGTPSVSGEFFGQPLEFFRSAPRILLGTRQLASLYDCDYSSHFLKHVVAN